MAQFDSVPPVPQFVLLILPIMAKFAEFCALVVVIFGVFSLCQGDIIDDTLRNPAAVQAQIRCVLDQGPCDSLGKAGRAGLKEAIVHGCRTCTRVQRANVNKISAHLMANYPREWAAIVAKAHQQ